MKLTKNFDSAEFYVHEAPPADVVRDKLPQVAQLAQWLRDLAGEPLTVMSYYRSPARNASVGGSSTSQHMSGEAVDLKPRAGGIGVAELERRVMAAAKAGHAPKFGQIIFYPDTGHTHISLPTSTRLGEIRQATEPEDGARTYPLLARVQRFAPAGAFVVVGAVLLGLGALWFLGGGGGRA